MTTGPHAESEAEVVGRHEHGDTQAGKKLSLTIVTPLGSVLARNVDELTAPGLQGEFGVLPGHVPFLAALRSGVLAYKAGAARGVYAVGPGYAEVGAADTVQILTSRAVAAGEVDQEAAQADFDAASAELKTANAQEEGYADKRARLDWARARLDAHARASQTKSSSPASPDRNDS